MIINYLKEMVPYIAAAIVILSAARFFIHKKANKKPSEIDWKREILIACLVVVLTGLFAKTILQGVLFIDGRLKFLYKYTGEINLIPFKNLDIKSGSVKLDILGNMLIFVPIGILFPLLWKPFRKMWRTVGLCLAISLFIELVQLFLPRTTDINDLIINTLGGLIGYLVYRFTIRSGNRKPKEDSDG